MFNSVRRWGRQAARGIKQALHFAPPDDQDKPLDIPARPNPAVERKLTPKELRQRQRLARYLAGLACIHSFVARATECYQAAAEYAARNTKERPQHA